MTNPTPLFPEFPPASRADWQAAAEASLKGRPLAKLTSQTYEGIAVRPIYDVDDVADLPHLETLPGQLPFLRGTKAAGYLVQPWLIAQELACGTPQQFNQTLLADLARGQTAVNLIPDRPTRLGLDPQQVDPASVGRGGISLHTVGDFATALAGVNLAQTPIFIRSGSGALPLAALLLAHAQQSGANLAELHGCLEADPLGEWVRRGTLPLPLDKAFAELALLVQGLSELAPRLRPIAIHGYPYANGGAHAVQELAFVLATAVATMRALQERGIAADDAAQAMQAAFSIGSDFFMEIAKLRAARLLWAHVMAAFGVGEAGQKLTLHGRTLRYNKTLTDAYVNMLRMTTEAFAAALGGVDSLHTAPFDEEANESDDVSRRELSRRIARNVQVILQEEANLTKLIDPAGGSWYVEWLTDQVAQRAWALFQEVERQGGMVAALQSGWVQAQVAATAVARAQNLATRKDVLVGTNLYADPNDIPTSLVPAPPFPITPSPLPTRHVPFTINSLSSLINAAQQGATLAELTAVLRADYAGLTAPAITPIPWQRAAEPFEQLRVAAAAAPQRPRIFLATMGPLRQHKARADFAQSFFAVGGFEIVYPQGFESIETAVAAALADGATAVVICSTDETYPELVPPLARALKAANPTITIILAGYPKEHVEAFRAAGVDQFIYLGADCLALNQWLQARLVP